MSNDTPDEPFLSRWSRQKRAGQQQKPSAAVPSGAPASPEQEAEPEIDLAALPKIEDLTAESDISVFLRKGVPEALQKLALRRMWSLDPEISNFVEVAENQFDFHAAGGIYGLYQELPAGTDMGVWMAQAAQSVVPKDPNERAAGTDARPTGAGNGDDSAVQHEPEVVEQQEQAIDQLAAAPSASVVEDAGRAQTIELAKVSGIPDTSDADVERPSSRRRHGGALPA